MRLRRTKPFMLIFLVLLGCCFISLLAVLAPGVGLKAARRALLS